jgi:hypothetical protein
MSQRWIMVEESLARLDPFAAEMETQRGVILLTRSYEDYQLGTTHRSISVLTEIPVSMICRDMDF